MMNRRKTISVLGAGLLMYPTGGLAFSLPLNVVATTGMIADLIQNVGGSLVNVNSIMGPGVDPHSYRHTRSDILTMAKADAVFYHGLDLEVHMLDFFHQLSAKRKVTAITEGINKSKFLAYEDYENAYDPHIWMDPMIWAETIDPLVDTLRQIIPAQSDILTANASAYRAQLNALDAYSKEVLSSVPSESAILVTAHDAFAYFGVAYGFEVTGVQGISTNSEAGLYRIGELVDLLVDRNVSAVFIESSVSDRNIRALIEGAAAKGHTVLLGGELFSDALGLGGSYEGTYIGMIDHNVTTIARALGGIAPERGWQNKLGMDT
jgi:manganese/zinc/iron transport system substrate-binding protein